MIDAILVNMHRADILYDTLCVMVEAKDVKYAFSVIEEIMLKILTSKTLKKTLVQGHSTSTHYHY